MNRGREWENRAAQQCANSNVNRRIYPPNIITVCLFRFYVSVSTVNQRAKCVFRGGCTSGCIIRVFSVIVSDMYTTSEGFSIRESEAKFRHRVEWGILYSFCSRYILWINSASSNVGGFCESRFLEVAFLMRLYSEISAINRRGSTFSATEYILFLGSLHNQWINWHRPESQQWHIKTVGGG